jgi:NADPH-dependent 2,4-dienoyl-CoA reductase/sulfur reductase-like enzyme/pSer/pThr/pTyr-binding forkhead associated (FHA) protein/Fe-S-cluster-containing hydrogenase component 2/CRP-like cAMP-binding protein
MDKQQSYLIIGNGITGVTAAEILRAEDPTSSITMVADDPFPVYYRPALKDYLGGRLNEEKLWARPNTFYKEQRIHFVTGHVMGTNTTLNFVQLHNGQRIGYHKLLLANGARPRQLSCPGLNLAGVTTLRTVADYQEILRRLESAQRIVICGSGTLALESAETLNHRGYEVTHLLRQHTLWSEVLDPIASDLVLQEERRDGIDVRTEEEIAEIVGRKGQVAEVITTRGARIPCDMVLIAIGIEPLIDFIRASGIACGRGVKVDNSMRTNIPHIYAAGDVIETADAFTGRTRVLGQWYPAIEQARTAAHSMLGQLDARDTKISRSNYYNATFLYGLDFVSMGLTTVPPNAHGYQEIVADPQPRHYRKVILHNGIPLGFLFLGNRKHALAFKRALDHQVNLTSIVSRMLTDDFNLDEWLDNQGVAPAILDVVSIGQSHTRRLVAPIHLANGLGAATAGQSGEMQGEGLHQHYGGVNEQSLVGQFGGLMKAYLVPIPHPKVNVTVQETEIGSDKQGEVITIGRQKGSSLLIEHSSVSRVHSEILYLNENYLLRDQGSSNGTFVNNTAIDNGIYTLRNLDLVRFGDVQFRFELRRQPVSNGSTASSVAFPHVQGTQLHANVSRIIPDSVLATLKETPMLVLKGEDANPRTVALEFERRLTIGRGKDNNIVLDDNAVSRRHAEIFSTSDGFYVRDLDSRNGVFVNKVKINNPFHLSHGDRIVIGNMLVYFSFPAGIASLSNSFQYGGKSTLPAEEEAKSRVSTSRLGAEASKNPALRTSGSAFPGEAQWEYSTTHSSIAAPKNNGQEIPHPVVVGMSHRGDVQALTEERLCFEIDMCIGCDRCMSACPIPMSTLVNIADLNHATISNDVAAHIARFTHECIMCGSCVPVCPVDNHRDLLMLSLKQRLGVSWDHQADLGSIAERLPAGWTPAHLISRLREHRFLSDSQLVPENYLLHLVASSRLRRLAPGEAVINEGEYGRDLYLILEGRLALFTSEFPIAILSRGEHAGEDGMLTGQPYKATAQSQVSTLVLQVPEQVMQRLMELVPGVQLYFDQMNYARSLKSILKRMALFQGVSDADIHALIQQTPVKQYERDERLFAEDYRGGRPSRETLHILLEGFVKVVRHTTTGTGRQKSNERIMAYRQSGDYFAGGLDLLGDGRAVSVTAINRVRVAEVPRQVMLVLLQHYPEVNQRFTLRLREYLETSVSTQGYALTSGPLIDLSMVSVRLDAAVQAGLHSLVSDGVVEGTEVLVIDLDKCIHCSECEEACARRHGHSRMNRKGIVVGNISIATACRQCQDPVCMLCSRAGIARHPNGEVYITESCIGCGICAERCPYGAISIINIDEDEPVSRFSWERFSKFFTKGVHTGTESYYATHGPLDSCQPRNAVDEMRKKIAIKCDLCAGYKDQACVEACPTGAAVRIQPTKFFGSTEEILQRRVF